MNEKFECEVCYHQALTVGFTPITVSANFSALECPKCLNNSADAFIEIKDADYQAA
ncbi:MAG: hypothetical protein ACSLFH_01190 [Desulfuromonadales bacterium]